MCLGWRGHCMFVSLDCSHVLWYEIYYSVSPQLPNCGRKTFLPTNINCQKQSLDNLPNSPHIHHWFIVMFTDNLLHGFLLLIGKRLSCTCLHCHSLAARNISEWISLKLTDKLNIRWNLKPKTEFK